MADRDLVMRLRACQRDSVQSLLGSDIFKQAADEVERLQELLNESCESDARCALKLSTALEERDEADRRAGAAERKVEDFVDTVSKRNDWLRKAKTEWGVDDRVSFDEVWKEALLSKSRLGEALKLVDEVRAFYDMQHRDVEPGFTWDGWLKRAALVVETRECECHRATGTGATPWCPVHGETAVEIPVQNCGHQHDMGFTCILPAAHEGMHRGDIVWSE
jgi:hypothetical protein